MSGKGITWSNVSGCLLNGSIGADKSCLAMVVLSTICPLVGNWTGFSISVPIIGSHNSSGGSSSKSFSISAKDSSRGIIASKNWVPFYGFYQSWPKSVKQHLEPAVHEYWKYTVFGERWNEPEVTGRASKVWKRESFSYLREAFPTVASKIVSNFWFLPYLALIKPDL